MCIFNEDGSLDDVKYFMSGVALFEAWDTLNISLKASHSYDKDPTGRLCQSVHSVRVVVCVRVVEQRHLGEV